MRRGAELSGIWHAARGGAGRALVVLGGLLRAHEREVGRERKERGARAVEREGLEVGQVVVVRVLLRVVPLGRRQRHRLARELLRDVLRVVLVGHVGTPRRRHALLQQRHPVRASKERVVSNLARVALRRAEAPLRVFYEQPTQEAPPVLAAPNNTNTIRIRMRIGTP